MSKVDSRVPVNYEDDDDKPPPTYNDSQTSAEVKRKPICPSFHIIFFLISGSICILLGTIDMIIFYVIPNKKINDNKKNYFNYTFEKPDAGIITFHFLEHLVLIALGVILVMAVNPKFYDSTYFILFLFIFGLLFGSFYFIEALYSGLVIDYVKNEDLPLSFLTQSVNFSHPINTILIYISGSRRISKGNYKKCYSKSGFAIPVRSNQSATVFPENEQIPDFFYLDLSQIVTMTNPLFDLFSKSKEKVHNCDIKHNAVSSNYPLIEGKKLILSDGKKIQSSMKRPSAIASVLFGLGVYPEMLLKSIPIKKIELETYADVVPDEDYDSKVVDCSKIGLCQTSNNMPTV